MKINKGFADTILVLGVLVLIGIAGYFIVTKKHPIKNELIQNNKPVSDVSSCPDIDNSSFKSLGKYVVGRYPPGQGHEQYLIVSFINNRVHWVVGDIEHDDSYSCKDNVIRVSDSAELNSAISFTSIYDKQNKILHWGEIDYTKVNSESDAISSWKIYKNEKYGLEIQIPQDWTVSETTYFNGLETREEYGGAMFNSPKTISDPNSQRAGELHYIDFFLSPNPPDLTRLDQKTPTLTSLGEKIISDKKFTLFKDKYGCYSYNYETGSISYYYSFSTCHEDEVNTLEKMLSTFKLTKQYKTTTWKKYHNEKYGFDVEIADNWTVSSYDKNDPDAGVGFHMPESNYGGIVFSLSHPLSENHRLDYKNKGKKIINGLEFNLYREDQSQSGTDLYEIVHNGLVYGFSISMWDDRLEKMLSTLKFTK